MKVVGNCPSCGNPIWADGPEITKRTCFCVVPVRTQPIVVQPQPYGPVSPWITPYTPPTLPPTYPIPGTWWCGNPNVTIATTANTLGFPQFPSTEDKPPDCDAGMVT